MEAVDVRDLIGHPGASRRVAVEGSLEGLRTELAAVPDDALLRVEVLLESVLEGIFVTGPVTGSMEVSCARCLRVDTHAFRVEVAELFAFEPEEEAGEYILGAEELDLAPMIRDAVLLRMPFSPLCRPDCLGLCERCGGDRNLGECACPPAVDPRWAPLQGLQLD
jgi:uncharacterized protein